MVFPEAVTELAVFRSVRRCGGSDSRRITGTMATVASPAIRAGEGKEELGSTPSPVAMNAAALSVYEIVRRDGSQQRVVSAMQTRAELYDFLDYHAYEGKLDELFSKDQKE
jgi:methylisocitrate lyase